MKDMSENSIYKIPSTGPLTKTRQIVDRAMSYHIREDR